MCHTCPVLGEALSVEEVLHNARLRRIAARRRDIEKCSTALLEKIHASSIFAVGLGQLTRCCIANALLQAMSETLQAWQASSAVYCMHPMLYTALIACKKLNWRNKKVAGTTQWAGGFELPTRSAAHDEHT
jgi:hypothetical protein